MAGLRPGLGRGGMTHSLEVIDAGVRGAGEAAGIALMASVAVDEGAGAGAMDGGEPADIKVEGDFAEAIAVSAVMIPSWPGTIWNVVSRM